MTDALMNRRHRWPADDTPLTGVHGGTAKRALLAIKEAAGARPAKAQVKSAKVQERERAVAIARAQLDQLLSKLPLVTSPVVKLEVVRKDRVRHRAATKGERSVWLRAHRERQGDICHYCRVPMLRRPIDCEAWRKPTLDHVVPLSKGGDDTFENTVAACFGCNNAKADLSEADFRASMRALRQKRGLP